ncbi:Protein of unknown function [Filomicrobium insigne]|uniref:DUF2796 domain-containing protein n=1 Tax=Filomicrobium insigne TaxID=418854 RepID=A0A1H0GNP1_9HYPH|nr:DUF2796 domain-containing protein [Filomicrobium insigne]SDO08656.1 Protein of unknown function [Filomicrobium insigne]
MRTSTIYGATILSAMAVMVSNVHAQHRELGAHEHGQGILNIAVEGQRVSMELSAPGADIVGFEHDATTDDQKAALKTAKEKLSEALSLFRLSGKAGCKVAETEVTFQTEEDGDHTDHHEHANDGVAGHDDAHKHEAHAKEHEHDHDHADHNDKQAHHAEFRATYNIKCETPAALTGIAFGYFDVFKNAQRLKVNVVTDKGQTSLQATREKPEVSLSGLM